MKRSTATGIISLLLAGTCTARAESPAAASPSPGIEIAAKHTRVSTTPPQKVPTNKMVDGPIMGNGDVGVVLGGAPDRLKFYIGKNDFWSVRLGSPINVGRVEVRSPQLAGGSWRTEQDMALAEVRGTFAKGAIQLATRSRLDANRNLLVTELTNAGTVPLRLAITVHKSQEQDWPQAPATVTDLEQPAAVGREEARGHARWFFDGEIAELTVTNKALVESNVTAAAAAQPPAAGQAFDKTTMLTVPPVSTELGISCWIKIRSIGKDANYILSKGVWNQAYSLGLSGGYPRFAIGKTFVQSAEGLPKDRWVHLAASYNGKQMTLFVDGKPVVSNGTTDGEDGDFLYSPYDEPDGKTPLRYGHLVGPILAPLPPQGAPRVAVATRFLGGTFDAEKMIALAPGATVTIATVILSNFDAKDCVAQAKQDADALTLASIAEATRKHRRWWANYWSRSYIEIADKVIEGAWVAGNYGMASCSRPGQIAPGIWGNWITTDQPAWRGDFHLNYNFQAPFYGVYANNHPELAAPFYQALMESVPEGRAMAKRHNFKGLYFPVSIGPWGWRPWGAEMTLHQKSNAAYAAMLFIWGYHYTQDLDFLKSTAYPYLRDTAEFWENYLTLKTGPDGKARYVIHDDAIHEGSGSNMNPILSLGLVRTLFANIVTMSKDLGVDAEKRAKWQDIHDKLSNYATQTKDGKTVFRYSEEGLAWYPGNTLGIQHIFPGSAVNLDSDPKLLKLCHDTIEAMARWEDNNGSSSWYPALARVGYDPATTLERLHQCIARNVMPNGLMTFGGGGIENWAAPMMITEFLMQSEDYVLRLFPCWPKEAGDARFGDLRAKGAFLVRAELKKGTVRGVRIVSEKGRDLTVVNPWPGKKVYVTRNGKAVESATGDRFTLKTAVGEIIELRSE